MNEKDQCSFCSKDFSELNKHNKEKHIEACRKKNGKRKSTSTITAYYQKKTKTSQTSSSESNLTESLSVREENNSDRNRLNNDVEIVEEVQVQGTKGAKNMRIGVELKYCSGFSPNPPINILQDFPYQILDSQPFVISKQKFHTKQCSLKDFVMDINVDGEINKDCSLLGKDSSLKRILARSQNDDPSTHIPNEYLTFNQLKNKLEKNQKHASLLSIENYKLNNKVEQLGKTLSFYKRFVIYIAENKVPRLHFLVNVALNNNRSIQYILGKCTDAVAGVYKARFDQDDKDLASLVLKFGGPSLLDILYRANVLPSTSLAYRMSKKGAHLKSFVDMSYKDCFNENFNMKFEGDESSKFGLSIKSDETFINPRLRYDSKANKIVGTCYEHHGNVNLDFKTMEDAEILQEKLSAGEIHIPKECLVTGISSVVKNVPFQVILMWPTCTKDDFQGMCSMFNNISQSIKNKIDANPLNFNTDGDSTRRQAMHAITQNELDSNSDLGKKILALPLIDTNVGNNLETVNYDAKHLSKRCWTSLISGKLEVANIQVTKQDVGDIMKLADIRTHEVESLVYPRDKQNVPLASDCLLSFIEVIKDEAKREQIPFKLTLIKNVLVLVAAVYEAIICLYSYAEHSLTDQVQFIATGASSLLALNREDAFKIPNQLYHDLQSTFIDTIFCIAKLQIDAPTQSFYTALNGTDPAERFFGNCRMSFGHKNLDAFELINSSSSISLCDEILSNHPKWVHKGRLSRRLVLDHSSCKDWSGNLVVSSVNLTTSWKFGLLQGQALAVKAEFEFNPVDLSLEGVTLKRPFFRVIGVSEREVDWSVMEEEEVSTSDCEVVQENEEVDGVELVDVIDSDRNVLSYFEVGGKNVYKATVLKQISKEKPLSADRLRKVRGLSKFASDSQEKVSLNDTISVGDPIIAEVEKQMKISVVVGIKDGDHAKTLIPSKDLDNISVQVQVRELEITEVDGRLYSTGKCVSDPLLVKGKNCMTIKPEISLNPPQGCSIYNFDKQLIQDISVHLTLSSNQPENAPSSSASVEVNATSKKVKCKICTKMVEHKEMRIHIGKHIINKEITITQTLCGFCGKEGCKPSLVSSSKSGNNVYYSPQSNCLYFYKYKRVGNKSTKTTPCTNRIITCPSCNMYTWSYNLKLHMTENHPNEDIDQIEVISDKEKDILKKRKC